MHVAIENSAAQVLAERIEAMNAYAGVADLRALEELRVKAEGAEDSVGRLHVFVPAIWGHSNAGNADLKTCATICARQNDQCGWNVPAIRQKPIDQGSTADTLRLQGVQPGQDFRPFGPRLAAVVGMLD